MASGNFTLAKSNSSGSYIQGKIVWYSEANNSGNYSLVDADLYCRKYNDSTTLTTATQGKWGYTLAIGSSSISGTTDTKSILTSWVKIATLSDVKVSHDSDGSKSVTISGSVSAPSGTSYAGKTSSDSKSVTLDKIPRASTITSASAVTLGDKCSIKWTPSYASFRYKIKFSMGSWSYTTSAIHPNKTSAYTYTGYTIPLSAASQYASGWFSGTMTATLYTYSNSSATTQVGSASAKTFTVTVPSASAIVGYGPVTLGDECSIKWKPNSSEYRYKIKFSSGSWSYTTQSIHPNTTSYYTYTGYTFDLDDIAPYITSKTGTMTATLYSYRDSSCAKQVGSTSAKSFTVTVPENSYTKPTVTMTISPIHSLSETFAELYIQNKSKVKATFSSSFKYEATLQSYSMNVDGKSYSSPYESILMTTTGNKTVTGMVTDSRTHTGTDTQTINVIEYSRPSISGIICERSNKDMKYADDGTYLHIKAKRVYSAVVSDGEQKNFCALKYTCYKGESLYQQDVVILAKDSDSDEVEVNLANVVDDAMAAYTVILEAVDDIGESATYAYSIPTSLCSLHLGKGGNKAAFGKYAETDNLLECAWDAKFDNKLTTNSFLLEEQEIFVGGDKDTYYPVHVTPQYEDNSQPAFLGVGKMLQTESPDWEGNHPGTNSSALSMGWLFRYNGWDENGSYIKPLYCVEEYASLIAHIEGYTNAAKGIVLYLRGGGASYNITCSIPAEINVYLEDTDISDQSAYTVTVSPRAYTGNKGIQYKGSAINDVVLEQGISGIWTYRKWYSGLAECWATYTLVGAFTSAWGDLYAFSLASPVINYPFEFVARPDESVIARSNISACWAYAEGNGNGLNTTTATARYRAIRPTENTDSQILNLDFKIFGRWK